MPLHRLLTGGRANGDRHNNGQRGEPDDRERDNGIADEQRP
jgi:hypothetical protein